MLYAVPYEKEFSSKKEESAFQHVLSRRLLDFALQKEYSVTLASLELCSEAHGKPYFKNFPVSFSISHCSGLVCCALSKQGIGIDAERVRPFSESLAERICTPDELRLLASSANRSEDLTALWTLKESMMKLYGRGIAYGFKNAKFTLNGSTFAAVDENVRVVMLRLKNGYVLSVCTFGAPPEQLLLTELSRLF